MDITNPSTIAQPTPTITLPKLLKWGSQIVVGGVLIYGWQAGWFEGTPSKCQDFSAWRMNQVYENSLFGKMGLKIIEVIDVKDVGSTSAGLKCVANVVTTHGEIKFSVTTRTIRDKVYMEMQPVF